MDRIEFVHSIEYNDFEKSIVRFFDENMALYNLVGTHDIGCITGNVDDKSITFDLKFNNRKDSKKVYLAMLKEVCIYGHLYSVGCKLNKNIINIELIDTNEECSRCE